MKKSKIRLSSIFQTEVQEEIFARCARDSMSSRTRLDIWEKTPVKGGQNYVSSIFSTKEQEELFMKCCQEAMQETINSDSQNEDKKKVLKK